MKLQIKKLKKDIPDYSALYLELELTHALR